MSVSTVIKPNRDPGISFIIRARNEEQTLPMALDTLKSIKVPYEIVLILHKCTDGSKRVAEQRIQDGMPIRIIEDTRHLSRAGYETLVTPASHTASIVHFYQCCFSNAQYTWIFKWDADFQATPELIEFLNYRLDLQSEKKIHYRIPCLLGTHVNAEIYLSNSLLTFSKHMFWETQVWDYSSEEYSIQATIQSLPVNTVKPYWDEPPWFINGVDPTIEKKWMILNYAFGPEGRAAARASSKELDESLIGESREYLETHDIYFFR
jgi:glycosyltransferase involved in cell wall biosynthesis